MSGQIIVSAKAAAARHDELLPALDMHLPQAVVYSNFARFDRAARSFHNRAYAARTARFSSVDLVWWPDGAVVFGQDGFPARVSDAWIDEQFPPWFRNDQDRARELLAASCEMEDIGQECLLLARFGEGTWGHWLGEILPRAVLAEAAYPGRFSYAVPAWTSIPGSPGLPASVLQSLQAYGIAGDRLIRLEADRNYRFRSLASVTSVRSDGAMHQGALELMRSAVRVDPAALSACASARIASLRTGVGRRCLANGDEVRDELVRRGFVPVEFETLSFAQQVCAFRSGTSMVCILGSGLTGVIFSPDQVKIIAPAPENWRNTFFYPLVQARAGKFADLRGPIENRDPLLMRDSSFRVEMEDLFEALSAIGMY